MSVTIIECNSQADVNRTINSSWTNTFQDPIPIRQGDSLRVRNTFINTIAGSSGNIILDEPINCIIWIGYYFMYREKSDDKTWKAGAPEEDFMPWIARGQIGELDDQQFPPVINQLEFTIPAGVYTPVEIATLISKEFGTFTPGHNLSNQADDADDLFINTNKFLQTSLPADAPQLAYPRFYHRDATNYNDNWFSFNTRYFYGASQANLVFNQDDDQRFRFQYLHTPVTDDTGAKIEVIVQSVEDDEGKDVIRALNRQSGVFFTKLEPKSFWQDTLNFDVDKILVEFENGNGKILTDINLGQGICTTANIVGVTNVVSKGKMKLDLGTSNVAADQTYAIMATNPLSLLNGGYYLISVTPFEVDYHEPTQTRNSIQAIVSRQYIMSNFVTGFADSSIPWINNGHDFMLTNVKVEILDAKSKSPAMDINKANAIFLEVIRAPPQKKNI